MGPALNETGPLYAHWVDVTLRDGPFIPGVCGRRPPRLEDAGPDLLAHPRHLTWVSKGHPSLDAAKLFVRREATWEAHEVLEALWHACGRVGPVADVVKACIKLCAADVKTQQGRVDGRQTHAAGARRLTSRILMVPSANIGCVGGIDVLQLQAQANAMLNDVAIRFNRLPV